MSSITHIVIIDNGAHSIKAGFSTDKAPVIIPNCVTKVKSERRRPFIGDQLEECKDYSGLFYILPFNKGFLLNWEVQRQVWDYLFRTKLKLPTDGKNRFSRVGLLITEPVYNFAPIRMNMIEFLFEDYGFGEILICSAAQLAAFQHLYEENKGATAERSPNDVKITNNNESPTTRESDVRKEEAQQAPGSEAACLVVDSGFSFTHVVPFVEGQKVLAHTKRIDVGGKVLTNHLKDIISYRQLNVLDETYVVNQMKEDCCFVSTSFWKDLEIAGRRGQMNSIARDYVLPDYINFKRGFIYEKEKHREIFNPNEHQRIRMNNERFQVPELLFNPGDVNIDQIGISHTIVHAVSEFNPQFELKQTQQESTEASASAQQTSSSVSNNSTAASSTPGISTGAGRTNLKDIDTDEEGEGLEDDEEEVVVEKKTEVKKPQPKESSRSKKSSRGGASAKKSSVMTNGSASTSTVLNGHGKAAAGKAEEVADNDETEEEDDDDSGKSKEEDGQDLTLYQDENVQSHLYNNILLIGGNCAFPNFAQRVYTDIRSSVPDLMNTRVRLPESPATFAWKGGKTLCAVDENGEPVEGSDSTASSTTRSLFHKYSIKRKEYDDQGVVHCAKKLATCQLPTFSKLSSL